MEKYNSTSCIPRFRREIAEGLLFTHARLSENTKTTLDAASFLYGLIEILSEKGLLTIEELDARKRDVARRLMAKNRGKGVAIMIQEPEYDKYTFKDEAVIDCPDRVELCMAACCRLPFALSKQDIREGVVHWDLGQPYIIAQENNGFCTHLAQDCWHCTVRNHRPVPCRAYDCRKDDKIWLDFKNKRVNPEIFKDGWPHSVKPEKKQPNST